MMLISIVSPELNGVGVYEGKVEILNTVTGRWIEKKTQSSFFPDNLTAEDIEAAIFNAYDDARSRKPSISDNVPWTGASGLGFQIRGRIRDGVIVQAYPVWKRQ
jgi:filamentous hemagglutinin